MDCTEKGGDFPKIFVPMKSLFIIVRCCMQFSKCKQHPPPMHIEGLLANVQICRPRHCMTGMPQYERHVPKKLVTFRIPLFYQWYVFLSLLIKYNENNVINFMYKNSCLLFF